MLLKRENVPLFCNFIISSKNPLYLQVQFLPDTVTGAAGREITRTSFLGPFLGISVFAEDEPKVADKFFSGNASNDKPIQSTLQQELENCRVSNK